MGAVCFYHLTETPLDQTLPMLVGKASGAGWRVLVRGRGEALLNRLDEALWAGQPTSFLPHGMAGGAHDALQPVLLGIDTKPEGFACLMSVDGAGLTAQELTQADRSCILFDGYDEAALNHARGQWKMLADAGCQAQYWAQVDGSWVKKAESGAP